MVTLRKILLTGTKENSIARFIGNKFHKQGLEVWLYSRKAKKVDKEFWHERQCDITSEKEVKQLLSETGDLDVIIMLADSGTGHGDLEELNEYKIKEFIDSKLTGSLILVKEILKKSI